MINRNKSFDLISGFFIIQIIVMHILQMLGMYANCEIFRIVMRISFFFMPWFYFKSGYMFNFESEFSLNYVIDKAKKLLLPFLTFFIIGYLFFIPFDFIESKRPFYHILLYPFYQVIRYGSGGLGNLPLWFLPSLFFANIIFAFLKSKNIIWLIILFPFIGYGLSYFNIELPLGLSTVVMGIFYFWFGYIFKKYEYKNSYIVISLILYLFFVLSNYNYLDFRSNTLISGNYFVCILASCTGLIFFIQIAKKINVLKFLNYIGKNSLIYFVSHWIIILFIINIVKLFNFEFSNYYFGILIFITTVLLTHYAIIPLDKLVKNRILQNKHNL